MRALNRVRVRRRVAGSIRDVRGPCVQRLEASTCGLILPPGPSCRARQAPQPTGFGIDLLEPASDNPGSAESAVVLVVGVGVPPKVAHVLCFRRDGVLLSRNTGMLL